MVWGREILTLSPDSTAYVFLYSIGEVTLRNAATARLATALGFGDEDTQHVLIASLISGDMTVKLQADAEAYVETCGSTFTSSSGAAFQIGVRERQPVIDAISGLVTAQCKDKTKRSKLWKSCCVLHGALVANSFPRRIRRDQPQLATLKLEAEECPQVRRILFRAGDSPHYGWAPQARKPAFGRKLHFTVEPLTGVGPIGEFRSPDFTTNTDGELPVTFVPFREGEARITVTVENVQPDEEEDDPLVFYVTIVKSPISPWKIIIPAAIIGAVACMMSCGPGKKPLKQEPPPIIP